MRYLIIHTNTILPLLSKQVPLPTLSPLPLPLPLPTPLASPQGSSTQNGKYIVRKRRHSDDDLSSKHSI